jgi:hypothetical protein
MLLTLQSFFWFHPLINAGLLTDTKESKKERCWGDYYNAQLLHIDAMREAKEDPKYDPRRTHLLTGKDGRLKKTGKTQPFLKII